MRCFWDARQLRHAPAQELHNGAFMPFAEHPGRPQSILAALPPTEAPRDQGDAPLLRVHPRDYLDFLGRGPDTPGLVLIKVHAKRIHYWDGDDSGELRV